MEKHHVRPFRNPAASTGVCTLSYILFLHLQAYSLLFGVLRQVSNYIACSMDGMYSESLSLSLMIVWLLHSIALYFYDSSLMFSQDVEVIWGRKWSTITWIYVFTRYSAVLLVIFDLIPDQGFLVGDSQMFYLLACTHLCLALQEYVHIHSKSRYLKLWVWRLIRDIWKLQGYHVHTRRSCSDSISVLCMWVLCMVTSTPFTNMRPGFSALRIYTLLDGKKFLAGIVFLLNLVPFATNLVSGILRTSTHIITNH